MKQHYISAKGLSLWMRLTKKWNSLYNKIQKTTDIKQLKKLNSLSLLLGVKRKVVLTTLAGVATLGVQAQSVYLYDIESGNNSSPVFEDINGDGSLDLISGEKGGTIKYFVNNGENAFAELASDDNPFDGIDVGTYSTPTLVDLDNDGDLDLVSGEKEGTIKFYKNDGENVFTEQTGNDNPFDGIDVGTYSTPTFEDIDGDGFLDLICGESGGTFKFYENNGSNIFTEQTATDNPFNGLDVGSRSTPAFSDVDNDGDLDLISGRFYGTINYFKNNGSNSFVAQQGVNNPFSSVNIGYSSNPTFADLDNDGDLDLFLGDWTNTIKYFQIDDNNSFTEQVNPFGGIDVGSDTDPVFSDLDGDGDLDLIVGEYNGTFKYFTNDGNRVFTEQTGSNNPFNGIDIGNLSAPTFLDLDNDGDLDLISSAADGTIKYYENLGSNSFSEQTGTDNPFNGVESQLSRDLVFLDLDEDGDVDLVSGINGGGIKYYTNNGSNVFTSQTGTDSPFDRIFLALNPSLALEDLDEDGDLDLIVNEYSSLLYYTNDGSNVFTLQSGEDNPFDGIDVGLYSIPAFADVDNDGDLELYVGKSDGTIQEIPFIIEKNLVGILSTDLVESLEVYPNPATSIINTEKGTLEILDVTGNTVLSTESTGQVDVSGLKSGVYIVTQNGKRTKLIIE